MSETTETVLTITDEDALRGLRYAVSVKGPDYTYVPPVEGHTSCVYVWEVDGELCPQCIVGFALHHLGVPLELISSLACNHQAIGFLAMELRPKGYVFTDNSINILRAAQVVQDSAMRRDDSTESLRVDPTWGAALAAAERTAATQAATTQGQAPQAPSEATSPSDGPPSSPGEPAGS